MDNFIGYFGKIRADSGRCGNSCQKIRIHFRRTSGNVRLTLFEGGHSGNNQAGFDFLSRQVRGRPADFTLPKSAAGAKQEAISR